MECDIKLKCRICLGCENDMLSLFEKSDEDSFDVKIMRCTKIQISEDDGGPTQICSLCSIELYSALKFQVKCEETDKIIKTALLKVKQSPECNASKEVKYCASVNIKQETDNDNSYDFFDSPLEFKNELEHLKEENYKHETPMETDSKYDPEGIVKSLEECEESLLIKVKRKSKVKIKRMREDKHVMEVNVPKKRGRKAKIKCEFDDNGDQWVCGICKKIFVDGRTLKTHLKIHNKSRDHTCHQCGKQFKYKDNLKVHAMTHTGEKPFQCDLCDKSFSKKDNLAIHRKRHLKERNFSCDQCGSAYYTSYELKTHMRSHTGEKPHVCTTCGKRFTAKNNLYIHQRSHTGEKPHVCTVCGKQFTSKNILTIHSRIHTGEKPYICSVCGKRFTANKLAVHMRTHTGEKPHVCTLCGKQFAATNVLLIHMRRHTGEKPYVCKICPQTFGHTQSLNKHMRKQHKNVTNITQVQVHDLTEMHRRNLESRNIILVPASQTSPAHIGAKRPLIALQLTDANLLDNSSASTISPSSLPQDRLLKIT